MYELIGLYGILEGLGLGLRSLGLQGLGFRLCIEGCIGLCS